MHEKVFDKLEFEVSEIEKMLSSYDSLLELCKTNEPNLIEKTAAASVLHSFYTGVENIIIAIISDDTLTSLL
ncbi:MAG: hypothetical protein JXJ04_26535 [Spirochaetales bacterium]|nr:hypothetical protein [Spirochaetales bacterium]